MSDQNWNGQQSGYPQGNPPQGGHPQQGSYPQQGPGHGAPNQPARPPQQAYQPYPTQGAYPMGGQPPAGRSKLPWIIGAAIALVLLALLAFFLLRNGGDDATSGAASSTPIVQTSETTESSTDPTTEGSGTMAATGSDEQLTLAAVPNEVGPWMVTGKFGGISYTQGDTSTTLIRVMDEGGQYRPDYWSPTMPGGVVDLDGKGICGEQEAFPVCVVDAGRFGELMLTGPVGASVADIQAVSEAILAEVG